MKKLYLGDIHYLLPAQKYGDWANLAGYIEAGGEITPDMRKFIGAVLRGAKRSNNRSPDMQLRKRDCKLRHSL